MARVNAASRRPRASNRTTGAGSAEGHPLDDEPALVAKGDAQPGRVAQLRIGLKLGIEATIGFESGEIGRRLTVHGLEGAANRHVAGCEKVDLIDGSVRIKSAAEIE
jgi:hypothetical protein